MKKSLILIMALFALVLLSCNKKEKEKPDETKEPAELQVVTKTFVVENGDGTLEIPVAANYGIKVTVAEDAKGWLSYIQTKAIKESTVVVGYRANTLMSTRTGNVTITVEDKSETVAITQAAATPVISGISVDSKKVNPKGDSFEVTVTSNDEIVATPAVNWISVKPGNANSFTVQVSLNDSGDAREGTVVFSAKSDSNVKESVSVTQKAANVDPRAISILSFGNDAVTDAMHYLYPVLAEMGYTKIRLGNLYIGNSDIDKHLEAVSDSGKVYKFNYIEEGEWKTADTSAVFVLEPEDWDYIVLSQTADNAPNASKYDKIGDLVNAIRVSNPFTSIAWNIGWAPKNGEEAFEGIIDAVSTVVKANNEIEVVIPAGTAIQNLRTSHFEDNVTRSDNKNLSFNIGRPTAAYAWAASLTGKSIDASAYVPDDVDDKGEAKYQYESDYLPAIKEAVKAAVASPLKLTASKEYAPHQSKLDKDLLKAGMAALGYPESMLNSYVEVPFTVIHNAFYNSSANQKSTIAADSPSTIMAGYSGSKGETNRKFAATHIFPHDALPVGTLIVLIDNTLQYCPEGWNTLSTANDGEGGRPSRPGNVTANVTEVTDAWWGTFTYRAFNISKRDGTVMTDADWAKAEKGFGILIPKTAIGDGLENYGNGSWKW